MSHCDAAPAFRPAPEPELGRIDLSGRRHLILHRLHCLPRVLRVQIVGDQEERFPLGPVKRAGTHLAPAHHLRLQRAPRIIGKLDDARRAFIYVFEPQPPGHLRPLPQPRKFLRRREQLSHRLTRTLAVLGSTRRRRRPPLSCGRRRPPSRLAPAGSVASLIERVGRLGLTCPPRRPNQEPGEEVHLELTLHHPLRPGEQVVVRLAPLDDAADAVADGHRHVDLVRCALGQKGVEDELGARLAVAPVQEQGEGGRLEPEKQPFLAVPFADELAEIGRGVRVGPA
eukprot:scaffold2093_cov96-Isochrysis_galbana.AAC.2